jgi:tetratricopeptide (TPR) repeat protein
LDQTVLRKDREPTGTVEVALAHARRLLDARPDAAAQQAREVLRVVPRSASAHLVMGLALARLDDPAGALEALQRAAALDRDNPEIWRALADQAVAAGEAETADAAYAQLIRCSTADPVLMSAAAALCEGALPEAERMLKARLRSDPSDVPAIRMLAELATRLGRYVDAENLLDRALELAPGFLGARHNYAVVLYRQGKGPEALAEIETLLAAEPANPGYLALKGAALTLIGDYEGSIRLYEQVLARHGGQAKVWLSLGHALKTTGRQDEAVAAYRKSLELAPALGEAWWSLANLKTRGFGAADEAGMRAALAQPGLSDDDRLHLHYALGKAAEDRGDHARAFEDYSEGAHLRRAQVGYDADAVAAQMAEIRAAFTPQLLADHPADGALYLDPIFIVGLPRSGSTLIEQILASHSAVEGTMELPDLAAIAKGIAGYPSGVAALSPGELRALGEAYLERTRIQRRSGRPLFIDKMPNNFVHAGLIRLILPNAKIIDARRHPMATGFAAFKQHFARGQHFSYDLTDLGRYWADYARLMDHFDAVMPGVVHRVFYERMVEDTEREVRRLLDYCGLPFEPACLNFHETKRAVRTASSEQVRKPIFRDGLSQWRNFEPWLEPLRAALGPALETYPAQAG